MSVSMVSDPIYGTVLARDTACFYGFQTYLQGSVMTG